MVMVMKCDRDDEDGDDEDSEDNEDMVMRMDDVMRMVLKVESLWAWGRRCTSTYLVFVCHL